MDRRSLARLTRTVGPFASLWLLFAAAIGVFAGLEIRADRVAAVTAARDETEAFAQAARALLADTLAAHDHALTLKKIVHDRRLGTVPPGALADGARIDGVLPRSFDQYDREGRRVAAGDGAGRAAAFVADEPWFDEARSRNAGEMIVGPAVDGRRPEASAIPLVKRLETPDGAFDGVIVAFIEPRNLLPMLGALATQDGLSLVLLDRRGVPYGRTVSTATTPADRPSPRGAARTPERDVAPREGIEGRPTFVARTELPGRGLSVVVALDEGFALALHRRHARTTIALAGLALIAIALALAVVGRRAFVERDRRRQLERRYAEARHRTRTDPLTLVANRAAFDDQLRIAHAVLAADGHPFVLACIGIDRLPARDGGFGRAATDRMLRRVARHLREGVRREDTIARLGGDEFAVLLPGGGAPAMRRVFGPLQRRLAALAAEEGWPVGLRIGVVAFESAPSRPDEAVQLVDRLLAAPDEAGGDGVRYAVYREGMLGSAPALVHAAA